MGRVAGARSSQRPQQQTEDVRRRRDHRPRGSDPERRVVVLMQPTLKVDVPMVALILATLWVLGSISSYTLGGYLHFLLLAAICLMLPRVIRGRKAAS